MSNVPGDATSSISSYASHNSDYHIALIQLAIAVGLAYLALRPQRYKDQAGKTVDKCKEEINKLNVGADLREYVFARLENDFKKGFDVNCHNIFNTNKIIDFTYDSIIVGFFTFFLAILLSFKSLEVCITKALIFDIISVIISLALIIIPVLFISGGRAFNRRAEKYTKDLEKEIRDITKGKKDYDSPTLFLPEIEQKTNKIMKDKATEKFNEAIILANSGEENASLDALAQAIKINPALKEKAKKEATFHRLKKDERFSYLTE